MFMTPEFEYRFLDRILFCSWKLILVLNLGFKFESQFVRYLFVMLTSCSSLGTLGPFGFECWHLVQASGPLVPSGLNVDILFKPRDPRSLRVWMLTSCSSLGTLGLFGFECWHLVQASGPWVRSGLNIASKFDCRSFVKYLIYCL